MTELWVMGALPLLPMPLHIHPIPFTPALMLIIILIAAPSDFIFNTATFNSVFEGCFPFTIFGDRMEEDDETVVVSLQLLDAGTVSTSSVTVFIIDNDGELNGVKS